MPSRRVAVLVWALVALAGTLYLSLDAIPKVDQALHAGPVDGCIDWIGARAFWEHVNPFSVGGLIKYNILQYGFGHPPTAPFWFLPLTRWGVEIMGVVVGYFTLGFLLVHLGLVTGELALPAPLPTALLLFAAVLPTGWFLDHLHMAQLSEAIALCIVLAWYFLRRDEEVLAGVMLGLATTFKLFPALIVVLLLLVRRWRVVIAAGASWLAVAVVMTARYGLVCWPQFFQLQRPIADRWLGSIRNSSLQGIVLRWFHPACERVDGTVPRATILAALLSLALVIGVWRLAEPAFKRRQIDLPFALFALVASFANPWNWEHYDVLLLFPLVLVAALALRRRSWPLAVVVVAVVWMLHVDIGLKSHYASEYFRSHAAEAHHRLHIYEVVNWLPQVILMTTLAILLARDRRRAVTPAS